MQGGLGFLEVGHHLAPFDFGEAAVVVHLLQTLIGILGLFEGGLCRALCALHLRRADAGQHLSLAHRAAFLHVECLQGAAVFEGHVDGLTLFQITRIGVADDAAHRVDGQHAHGDDTFLGWAADQLLLELLRVAVAR